MRESADTLRVRAAKIHLDRMVEDLRQLDNQLSFIQGDEMCETGSDSVHKELAEIRLGHSKLSMWLNNALDTLGTIDKEIAARATSTR